MSALDRPKRFLSLVLATGLISPSFGWARESLGPGEDLSDSIPFIYQETKLRRGTMVVSIFAVPEEVETRVIREFADAANRNHRKITLATNGVDDPGFQAAMASGNLDWINTYRMGRVGADGLVPDGPVAALANRVEAKISAAFGNATRRWPALVIAIGATGSIDYEGVYIQTHDVTATLQTLVPTALFTAFYTTQDKAWSGYYTGSGVKLADLVQKTCDRFGYRLRKDGRHVARVAGEFAATMVPNTAIAALTLHQAGQSVLPEHLIPLSMATNYAIWDPVVDNLVRERVISHEAGIRYSLGAVVLGTFASIMMYKGVDGVQAGLGMITVSGLFARVFGPGLTEDLLKLKGGVRARLGGRQLAAADAGCEGELETRRPAHRGNRFSFAAEEVGVIARKLTTMMRGEKP